MKDKATLLSNSKPYFIDFCKPFVVLLLILLKLLKEIQMETKKHITKSFSVPVVDAESCYALGKLERHCERTGKRFNFMVMQAIKMYVKETGIDDGFEEIKRNSSKNV